MGTIRVPSYRGGHCVKERLDNLSEVTGPGSGIVSPEAEPFPLCFTVECNLHDLY